MAGEEGRHARQRAAARPIEEDLACRGALSREDDATAQAVRMQDAR